MRDTIAIVGQEQSCLDTSPSPAIAAGQHSSLVKGVIPGCQQHNQAQAFRSDSLP